VEILYLSNDSNQIAHEAVEKVTWVRRDPRRGHPQGKLPQLLQSTGILPKELQTRHKKEGA